MTDNVQAADLPQIFKDKETVVNDFQIVVATVNGTGSQTSNSLLLRALFRMGIPVNGKNIFPSNIKTLPTWFTIRTNKNGYTARKEVSEVLVAFNSATIIKDVQDLPAGGVCLYDTGTEYNPQRDDVLFYPLPIKELMKQAEVPKTLEERINNMVYVGALAYLIGLDLDEVHRALVDSLKGKMKAVDLNMNVIKLAYDYASENYVRECPYRVERMDATDGMILMDGNSAAALGAVFGGVQFISWYPITPSSSVADALSDYLGSLRHEEDTGKATYAIIQAEDELAAIGMVLGAGWAGARAMTRATAVLACLLLAACGQKGNLYMPDEAREVVPVTTSTSAQDADDSQDDAETQRQQQGAADNAAGN